MLRKEVCPGRKALALAGVLVNRRAGSHVVAEPQAAPCRLLCHTPGPVK